MKKLLALTLILVLTAGMLSSCKKDNGTAPVLPPQESMTIDFTNFLTQKKSAYTIIDNKGTNNTNWEFAAGVAGIWNLIITTTLAVPVSAFKLAIDKDPVFLSNKTWQWSYSVSAVPITYKARLTGQISGTDVLWKMYVTREGTGGFAEFVWFSGTSKLDGTGGQWILNESAAIPEAYLQIDWAKTGTAVGSVKYTFIKNHDAHQGGYIEYGLISGALNAFYNIHYFNEVKFSDVNVEWNTTTFNGRVKSSDYLLGTWFCWDSNKVNATCL